MSYACTSFLAGLFIRKVDLIIATSPQFFTTWSGYALSIFKRKPWIFELRDLWPESIVTVGAMKKGKAIKLLEKIELFLYKKAHKIISVTDSFVENLANRGVDRNKISVVKNGVDLEKFKRIEPDDLLQKKINPQNRFVVSYIGTMGMAHAIDFIIDSVASMDEAQRKNFLFLFVGDGAKRYELEEKMPETGSEKYNLYRNGIKRRCEKIHFHQRCRSCQFEEMRHFQDCNSFENV